MSRKAARVRAVIAPGSTWTNPSRVVTPPSTTFRHGVPVWWWSIGSRSVTPLDGSAERRFWQAGGVRPTGSMPPGVRIGCGIGVLVAGGVHLWLWWRGGYDHAP